MFDVFPLRLSVQYGFSSYYYHAFSVEPCRKFSADVLRFSVGVFQNTYFYELAFFETIGKTEKHIFAYSVLADLPYRGKIRGKGF